MARGWDCGQLMMGQVKRGKGRSLGLHGAGGREGRRPWRGWRVGEAAARAPAQVREGRGTGDPWPRGWLSLRAAQWVRPKATGLAGMRVK
jgi:hypothetical protein